MFENNIGLNMLMFYKREHSEVIWKRPTFIQGESTFTAEVPSSNPGRNYLSDAGRLTTSPGLSMNRGKYNTLDKGTNTERPQMCEIWYSFLTL